MSIPRGHRKEYIPGWSDESEALLQDFELSGDDATATALIDQLNNARKEKWMETVKNMDFTHSSRKSWGLLRKLGGAEPTAHHPTKITANKVARHIQSTSKINIPRNRQRELKSLTDNILKNYPEHTELSQQINIEEIETALKSTKRHKAAGRDELPPEFLIELGVRGKTWLTKLFTSILNTGSIPDAWSESKTLAVLKPGKDPNDVKSYRPIALLCTTFKLLERVLLARLTPLLDPAIPNEQAGFRQGRSCCDQVTSLTSYIESGFQKKLKTGAIFMDLSSAYDTVWREGLIYKLSKIIKCQRLVALLDSILAPRRFKVYLNCKMSKTKYVYNGLPQGSVLAPILYNWYTHDLPQTSSKKFIYADDIAILSQHHTFEGLEKDLNKDLKSISAYLKTWSLKLNPQKTIHTCFHLNNSEAQRPLNIKLNDTSIRLDNHPKYLGITLDRSLTFKTHLTNTRKKISTRNNIIQKLAGSTWGSSAEVLRTSSLALVYSTAEYCAPVWGRSSHTSFIDVELNRTMRIITGTCKTTPTPWLPVLSNIHPPNLRRKLATGNIYKTLSSNLTHPIQEIFSSTPPTRLKSRKPFWTEGKILYEKPFNINQNWREEWDSINVTNKFLVDDPTARPPSFTLPRKQWSTLNRFRTGQGRSGHLMQKWGYVDDPQCPCGQIQTMQHIIEDCPSYSLRGGLIQLHSLSEPAETWLKTLTLPI
jgi:hypothetical protein